LIALIFLLLASTAGVVYVFLHVRRFFRDVKSVSAAMDGPVRDLERSVERLSTKMESAESTAPKLEASVQRLQRSTARLTVLRTALQDSLDSFAWLTAVYPRK
jgi:sigma54-dependent transcription regulator